MFLSEDRLDTALEKFLSSRPELQTKLNNLSSTVADNLGYSIEDYRQQKLAEAFGSYAKENGLDTSKLIIDLAATNDKERAELHLERHKLISQSLGMEFSEYCKQNQIEA